MNSGMTFTAQDLAAIAGVLSVVCGAIMTLGGFVLNTKLTIAIARARDELLDRIDENYVLQRIYDQDMRTIDKRLANIEPPRQRVAT